jgi:hypothetical protein
MTVAKYKPPTDVALLADAAAVEGARRGRVAGRLSLELREERVTGADIRTGAVRVADLNADAARLLELSAQLEEGKLVLAPASALVIDPAKVASAVSGTPEPAPATKEPATVPQPPSPAGPPDLTDDELELLVAEAEFGVTPEDDPDLHPEGSAGGDLLDDDVVDADLGPFGDPTEREIDPQR